MSITPEFLPGPWADDVPLMGERRPKDTGQIDFLIEYLLTVYKRFGNTAVTFKEIKWGASALWSHSDMRDEIDRLAHLAKKQAEQVRVLARLLAAEREYDMNAGDEYGDEDGDDGDHSHCDKALAASKALDSLLATHNTTLAALAGEGAENGK